MIGCGIYLTVATGFVQIRRFPAAIKVFIRQLSGRKDRESAGGYRALCTALAATVGTGNIAGVAGAIALGGPGAVFWMCLFGVLGMAVKFAEAALAVKYRIRDASGQRIGGPMYMIEIGLGQKWRIMAVIYSFFGVVAAFGVGNATQINTVVTGINSVIVGFGGAEKTWFNLLIGCMLAVLIGTALLGGAKRIGAITEQLVPFACVGYVIMCVVGIFMCRQRLPAAIRAVFAGALSPKAATSGALGSAFIALRVGASRGLFTNEAGMGTAAIAHASSDIKNPAEQGYLGIIEVFLDTIVICTLTALVILTSGVPIPYGMDTGLALTAEAFSNVFDCWINIPLSAFLCLFAVATVLGWGLYGTVCAEYLFGRGKVKLFVYMQIIVIIISCILKTQTVWILAEAVNGLMAIPNLATLVLLSPKLKEILGIGKPLRGKTRRGRNQPINFST